MQEHPSAWAAIGLSADEERVYRTLLRQPEHPVDDLDRPALRRLVQAGFIELADDHYRPVDPRLRLGELIRARRADLDRLDRAAEDLAADFHEGLLRTTPERLTEVVDGSAAVARRMEALLAGAEHEVLALDTPPYVTSGSTSNRAELALLARGVRCRAVYAHEVLDLPHKLRHIRESIGAGEQARVMPKLPVKLLVVDRSLALLPLTGSDEGRRDAAVVVRRSALCDALVGLFESLWSQAADLHPDDDPHPTDPVSGDQKALLALLGAGLKDEAIGRALGLSERTLRRRITELHARLGATSRFQAGVQAARQAWL